MTSVRASCVSIGIVTGARSSTVILDEERSGFEGQVAVNHDANPLQSGAGDRDRTGTGLSAHGILSPRRLPIPPLRPQKTGVTVTSGSMMVNIPAQPAEACAARSTGLCRYSARKDRPWH